VKNTLKAADVKYGVRMFCSLFIEQHILSYMMQILPRYMCFKGFHRWLQKVIIAWFLIRVIIGVV